MSEVSFSYYQVIIVFLFLLSLFLAHFYVRKNKNLLSGKLGTSKYMQVLEDLSIGPSEKIRLVKVGSELILLASSKGSSPSIQVLSGMAHKKNRVSNTKSLKENVSNNLQGRSKHQIERKSVDGGNNGTTQGYGNALKTAIQQARKMNPHVSF